MGVVYVAADPELARDVALKVVGRAASDSPSLGKRLVREARSAAQLQHANIITIFDVGQVDGSTYLAMELIAGRSLRAYVGDRSIPLEQRVAWLVDVARALAAAHKRGIVHRDIKPENVMVREDGTIKVVDFGIARRTELRTGDAQSAPLTATNAIVGTPLYMAPEQLRNEAVDARCNQFSWGVLTSLVSGKRPWKGSGLALVGEMTTVDAPPLPSTLENDVVPPALQATIGRALAKAPAARFASMDDVAAALLAACPPARAPSAPTAPERHGPRGPIALGLVVALASVGLLLLRTPRAAAPPEHRPSVDVPPATVRAPEPPWTAVPPPASASIDPSTLHPAPGAATARPRSSASTLGHPLPAKSAAPAATPATVSPPPAGCNPPYTWHAGVKVPKPECPLD